MPNDDGHHAPIVAIGDVALWVLYRNDLTCIDNRALLDDEPESIEKITDQERSDLLRTMTAYAGTYKFDGSKVEHHIDISMNETWTGTTQVRSVKRDGERLVYTTPAFRFHTDGKMSINTLIWEKQPLRSSSSEPPPPCPGAYCAPGSPSPAPPNPPTVPPLGTTECHQAQVCDAYGHCRWQQVCR